VTRLALHILFFLSGVAALGYQLVWSKMFSTGLGHEMPAVLAIIGAFMAGMALGAAVVDRFIPRDARAGLWLCGLELTIGVWAILVSFAIPRVNELVLQLIGLDPGALKHWTIAFAIPALTLLPATMAMGATLPAMEKFLSINAPQNESIGSVYAANTFGGVAGTLLAPYVLMPALGLGKSCWVLAATNALVAMSAFFLSRDSNAATAPARAAISPQSISEPRIRLTLFLTGLLGIGYETSGIRVLSQVLKNTVFTYAAVLAVFLVGTAAGAAAYHRWWRKREPRRLLATLLCGTALACFSGMLLMTWAPAFYLFARKLGDSRIAVLIAEVLTAALAFALPTFCMGATFSHLAQMARAASGRIGTAVALNTLGAALAPAVCGVILIPWIGTKWTLLLVGVGYALLLPAKPNMKLAVACVGACACVLFTNLCIISVPPGGEVVAFREGVMASVSVIAEGSNRTLRVDNSFQMGGTASADAEYRQAHIPLLLHAAPRRALFLGVGTGISFGVASLYPQLKADGVELVPEVVDVMRAFEPKNFSPQRQPNLKLHIADARRFVRSSAEQYDVIIGDLFHPYRDGAGALYTREHFAAVRARLATNGLFCQWLPLHQLDEPALRVVIRTFLEEFPKADAWLLRFNVTAPVLGLIGGNGGHRFSTNWIENRLVDPRLAMELKRLALADSVRVFGHRAAGPDDLRQFAEGASLSTDDNPRVTFMAPRLTYQRDAKPYASLFALLDSARQTSSALHFAESAGDAEVARRVSNYITARNVYLRGLRLDAEERRDDAIAAYVESARLSPEFTSGYAQCLTIASVIASSDPARAKKILERLMEAQPERPVAKEMLERLFPR
jgi:spermidine synthase